eukprot:10475246-Alexandrium_andersonii.AAC.1
MTAVMNPQQPRDPSRRTGQHRTAPEQHFVPIQSCLHVGPRWFKWALVVSKLLVVGWVGVVSHPRARDGV